MAHSSQISALPVNIITGCEKRFKELSFHSLPGPGSKSQTSPVEEHHEETLKSLQIKTDPRLKAIRHYKDNQVHNHHLERLMKKKVAPESEVVAEKSVNALSFDEIVAMESANRQQLNSKKKDQYALEDRMDWQEAFDKSVTRLMIDFDLTHAPHCRLNHLDRMDKWFLEHGGKQQRKAKKAPSYVSADRTSTRMPAGSTRDLGGKLSATSQLLAGSYLMRGSGSSGSSGPSRTFHTDGSQTAR